MKSEINQNNVKKPATKHQPNNEMKRSGALLLTSNLCAEAVCMCFSLLEMRHLFVCVNGQK